MKTNLETETKTETETEVETDDKHADESITNLLKVYPNPTNGELFIVFENNKLLKVELYSIQGQMIFSNNNINAFKHSLNLEKYSNGLYVVKIVFDNQSVTYKNIILKP